MGKKKAAKTREAKAKTAKHKEPTPASGTRPGVVAKLDPTLLLAVAHARAEKSSVLKEVARRAGGTATTPHSLVDMPVGIQSLGSQLAPIARSAFYRTDQVPVLVEVSDRASVEKKVAQWKGKAAEVTARVLAVTIPRNRLAELAQLADVRYVEASHRLKPHSDLAHGSARLWVDGARSVPQTGRGVLVGIVDTGIDVSHPSFWSGSTPRIVEYFDQEQNITYTQADITNGQGANSPDLIGHGTHVAGIAAGNGAGSPELRFAGVAPESDLAIVKTTFQSDDIAKAVKHVFDLAEARQQPCVVNLSLGGHFGGHDGSSITERTIDELSGAGRLVVISAGNEGSDHIHAHALLDRGGTEPAQWTADLALKTRTVDGSLVGLLMLQVWHQHEDDLRVRLRSPNGEFFEPPAGGEAEVNRGNFIVQSSHQLAQYSGDHVTTFVIITAPQHQWLRGWSIRVNERRDGNRTGVHVGAVHAWILDVEMGEFTQGSTPSHLIGMPGTAYSAITVASYATRRQWRSRDPAFADVDLTAVNLEDISYFSSPGPTRDGYNKPEIAAPGQWLISALSSDAAEEWVPTWTRIDGAPYAAMQGTSMSAPYVSGALALLLEKHPQMDWAEAKRRIIKSTRQDEFTTPCWNERWGYGKLNVERLLTLDPGPGGHHD